MLTERLKPQDKELTVIIPFLNEGEEVYNTVQNLRKTSRFEVNILLINDSSKDNYDYENVAKEFGTMYINHEKRKGVAASRDEGIQICPTEFFLLMDAHMRFFQDDWAELILNELHKNRRALFCCQSIALEKDEKGVLFRTPNRAKTCGAYIDFSEVGDLQVKWNIHDANLELDVEEVACVYGAGYACNKTYWNYLNGLKGLRSYGFDEQFISLKVWLEGGTCRLLKKVEAGHIYRKTFPYKTENIDLLFNRFYIAELLLPYKEKYNVLKNMESKVSHF